MSPVSAGLTYSTGIGTSTLKATTSPMVGYITATSTTATSTFAGYLQVTGTISVTNVPAIIQIPSQNDYFFGNSGNLAGNGSGNTSLGNLALHSFTSGGGSTAFGNQALNKSTTSGNNTAVGNFALSNITTGNGLNTAIGSNAGFSLTTGEQNVLIGYNAGQNGSQKVDAINSIAIGASTFTTADNQIILGNTSIQTVGIGTTSPYAKLSVVGQIVGSYFTGTTTATSTFGGGINLSSGCFAISSVCLTQNGGTVTSVAASVPAFLSISGSPVTGAGTLAISYSGTALPIANGGTNATSLSANSLLFFNGTSVVGTSSQLTVGSLLATTTATSTFAGGINITSGCHALNGICIGAFKSPGFAYATTTWSGTTTLQLPSPFTSQTIQAIQCYSDVGTLNVDIYHTSTHLTLLNASTTQNVINFTSNNTMTAGEKWYADIGTPASSPKKISCTFKVIQTSN